MPSTQNSESYTVANVTYDSNNDDTLVEVEERTKFTTSGTLIDEVSATLTASSMLFSGGIMFYGNIHWPTRFPDVIYTTSGNYDVRIQNEYVSSGIGQRGPARRINGVDKVITAWHLETAKHVYVKDTASFNIADVSTADDWFEVSTNNPNAFISGATATVKNRIGGNPTDHTIDFAEFVNSTRNTRIHVDTDLTDSTVSGTIESDVWYHYNRLTPNEQGVYASGGTLYTFSASQYEDNPSIEIEEVPAGEDFIDEKEVVTKSRVNRPLEVTSDGFEIGEESDVRAIFQSRLAEEESLQNYSFYIGTGKRIYVAQPKQGGGLDKRIVTDKHGIGLSHYNYAVHAAIPGGSVIKDSEGILRFLSGRQTQRLEQGLEPWNTIHDIEYEIHTNYVAIATEDGVWFYDLDRQGLFKQHDEFEATALAYSRENNVLLGWDKSNSIWKKFDGSGSQLTSKVTTQSIETGGRELELRWVKADYDKSGYQNDDKSTFAELWHTVRSSEVMNYSDRPDMIKGEPVTSNSESQGNTSIEVTTDSNDSVDLKSGEEIRFTNHSDSYQVASDVSIGNSSSGTITLSSGLNQQVPSGTKIRPDKYRGIIKLLRNKRTRVPFKGAGHQLRISDFDTLRDIQFRLEPRLNYE